MLDLLQIRNNNLFSETMMKENVDFVLRLAIEMHILWLDWPLVLAEKFQ